MPDHQRARRVAWRAAAALAVGALAWWLVAPDGDIRTEGVRPLPSGAANDDRTSTALHGPSLDETRDAEVPTPAVTATTDAEVSEVRGDSGVFLTGVAHGLVLEEDEIVRLRIHTHEPDLGELTVELDHAGPFTLHLGHHLEPYLELGLNLPRNLWVHASHPRHFDLVHAARVEDPPAPEDDPNARVASRAGQRLEYRTELFFEREVYLIRGRARLPAGRDPREAQVAYRYDSIPTTGYSLEEVIVEDEFGTHVETEEIWEDFGQGDSFCQREHCAADGRFELAVRHSNPGLFVVYGPWVRPITIPVTFAAGPVVDVGEVVLHEGAALEGTAWFEGALVQHGWISARLVDEPPQQNFDGLFLFDRRFVHGSKFATLEEGGGFRFEGLEADDHELRVYPIHHEGARVHYSSVRGMQQRVRAPALGVRAECPLVPVTLRLTRDGQPVAGGSLRRYQPGGKRLDGRPEDGQAPQWEEIGADGATRILIHRMDSFLLEVQAPGCARWKRVVSPAELSAKGDLRIELVAAQ